jgi:cysteine desulfurase/selenocysteine lyase
VKASAQPALRVDEIRQEFPILRQTVRGQPLAYLDNAATTQKPAAVIDAVASYYREANANVHRAVYELSGRATALYEGARDKVRRFVNARSVREIVFVRGTTEAINLVAQSYGRGRLGSGDEVLITHMEHHSNIVPWQLLCESTGATLRVASIDDAGELDLGSFERALGPRTRIVAIGHVSNALGTINPVRDLVARAHARGVPVLVDGAQAAPHLPIDVQDLGCDFYALSGHKMYAPTGIGVLWAREELLDAMPPWQGGGDMIKAVSFEKTVYNDLPFKFEAGTPNVAGAVGLAAAIDWLQRLGYDRIGAHESDLLAYATRRLDALPGVRPIGTARDKASVYSFVLDGVHPHDLGTILDDEGIAVRTGHHCAMPVMDRFRVPATTRASFGVYNTREEIDRLAAGILRAKEVLG